MKRHTPPQDLSAEDPLSAAIRAEINIWCGTRWPKGSRVGSSGWVTGLTNRIARAVQATQAEAEAPASAE